MQFDVDVFSSHDELLEKIRASFKRTYVAEGCIRMIGLLYTRPELPLAQSDVIPHLEYFHHRSAKHFDLFCAGYVPDIALPKQMPTAPYFTGYAPDLKPLKLPSAGGRLSYLFKPAIFNVLRGRLEQETRWQYSGESDLILLNAKYDPDQDLASLDFSDAIVCCLEKMKDDKAIRSVSEFLESICWHAEHSENNNGVWEFSDSAGLKLVGSTLKGWILSWLPKSLKAGYLKAENLVVRDISAPKPRRG